MKNWFKAVPDAVNIQQRYIGIYEIAVLNAIKSLFPVIGYITVAQHSAEDAGSICRVTVGVISGPGADINSTPIVTISAQKSGPCIHRHTTRGNCHTTIPSGFHPMELAHDHQSWSRSTETP